MWYTRVFIIFINLHIAHMLFAESPHLSLAAIEEEYKSIRHLALDSTRVVEATGFSLQKDVAEFEFKYGHIYFFQPVGERVVAAYFEGAGKFRLHTDDRIEIQQIRRFTDRDDVEQDFEQLLFFFTDSTYEQVMAKQKCRVMDIRDSIQDAARLFRQKIRDRFFWNIDARVLFDLAVSGWGTFFCAFLECSDDKELMYVIDPLDDEEVSLLRYDQIKFSKRALFETWYSSRPLQQPRASRPHFDIERTEMDVVIDPALKMKVTARVRFTAQAENARMISMEIDPVLRVSSAIVNDTDTCLVIQEDEKADAQLWLVFQDNMEAGRSYDLQMIYSGEGMVENIGGDNFVVATTTSWFPSFYTDPFDPRRFIMRFEVPEKMTLIATGEPQQAWHENGKSFSIWDSKIENYVAGFNYGKFSEYVEKSASCDITCFTNTKLFDALLEIRKIIEENKDLQATLMLLPQELTTDGIGKNAAIEIRNAYEVYVHFFGEIPLRKIRVSQQPYTSFAWSLPSLIFLPFTAFYDESIRERLFSPALGFQEYRSWESFHEGVASHELAHQWWAHTVITTSYHDEWLNEGFATYSEALHLQLTKGVKEFRNYLNMVREQVLSEVEGQKSLAELGPIWLGERLSSLDVPQGKYLIYVKGAYVLHMLRMMLFDYDKKSDERFIQMMQEYVDTYTGKIVTTEDFKKVLEKHFAKDMDWFFEQWVFGTEIPVYRFNYEIEEDNGDYFLTIGAQQSGVPASFEMPVPFVVNFHDGHAVVQMVIKGDRPIAKKFHLPAEPVSIEPNPLNAVLCTIAE